MITQNGEMSIAKFSIAIDRGKDKGTDFPNIVCFNKTAELVARYISKGRLVGIQGRIQTGKYEKEGRTIYTTDVIADRVEFLDRAEKSEEKHDTSVDGFSALDDEIPF